jgi:hypothetical protein
LVRFGLDTHVSFRFAHFGKRRTKAASTNLERREYILYQSKT